MKFMVKQEFCNHIRNLLYKICCFRFVTFIIMAFFIMDRYVGSFRESVRMLGEAGNIAVLPFLQTSDSYMKMIFLGIVYVYSNVPFMEKAELFYLNRLGKSRWGWRNIWYLVGSSYILSLCLFILSIIEVITVGKFSFSWGRVYKTLALTGGNLEFLIPHAILKEFEPFALLVLVLFLDQLVILLIGMVMYVISLYGHRMIACVTAITIVFLPSIDAWIGGRLVYYSPLAWLDCSNWRIGYNNAKPDLPYILVAVIFLNAVLIIVGQHRIKKMEWTTLDD